MSTPNDYAAGGRPVPPRWYLRGAPAGFGEAIRYGLRNWHVYRGRASRSAYWWFTLFAAIVELVFDLAFTGLAAAPTNRVSTVVLAIAVLVGAAADIYLSLAGLALLVRRIHDIGRTGWWVLVGLVPIAGPIILLVFALSEGTPGPNRYGLGAADAAARARPIRCPECGAETTEAAQACPRCGAPIIPPAPMGGPAAGWSGDQTGPPHESASHHPGFRSRPNALVIAGAALAALVAAILVLAMSASSTSVNSATSSSSPVPSASQASEDELQAGDCLTGSDLGLDTSSPWPNSVTAVPCTQQHIAEVFFAGNAWPDSQAYPGDAAINGQAEHRCDTAFAAYDGITYDNSVLSYAVIQPSGDDDWASGDRWLVCVAYNSTSQYPGGAPLDSSIKGTDQ